MIRDPTHRVNLQEPLQPHTLAFHLLLAVVQTKRHHDGRCSPGFDMRNATAKQMHIAPHHNVGIEFVAARSKNCAEKLQALQSKSEHGNLHARVKTKNIL
jgi:hypothetical protein